MPVILPPAPTTPRPLEAPMASSSCPNGQIPTGPIMALALAVTALTWLSIHMTQEQVAACAPLFTALIAELIQRLLPERR